MTLDKLTSEALQIPTVERLRLAEQILASLDAPDQFEIDAAWGKEVEDRITAFERAEVEAIDADLVHNAIEKRLGYSGKAATRRLRMNDFGPGSYLRFS